MLLAPLVAGCDTESVLEVDEPEFATPAALETPEGLTTLYNGAIGEFQIAFSASGEQFLTVSSVFTDEMYTADSFATRLATDSRRQQAVVLGNTSDAAFNRLQSARRQLAASAAGLARFSTIANDPRRAEVQSLQGYTYILLAEAFCGAIPISEAPGGAPGNAGNPLTTQQAFEAALVRFDSALAVVPTYNLARIGRARALLNLARFNEASAAVAGVPRDFVYLVRHSANTARQANGLFGLQNNGRYSVSNNEGINGLPYRSANDPRVLWDTAGTPFSPGVPFFRNRLHASFDTDVPLADGVEARLIVAEALLRAGSSAAALDTLNVLRANVNALMRARWPEEYAATLASPLTRVTRTTLEPLSGVNTDVLFRERAFWMYTTGKRHGDLRRLVRQYGRPAESVFPTGEYIRGGTYGQDVVFPVPFDEVNNPNYKPEQCVTTQA
jgi:hypothetical protein